MAPFPSLAFPDPAWRKAGYLSPGIFQIGIQTLSLHDISPVFCREDIAKVLLRGRNRGLGGLSHLPQSHHCKMSPLKKRTSLCLDLSTCRGLLTQGMKTAWSSQPGASCPCEYTSVFQWKQTQQQTFVAGEDVWFLSSHEK